MVATSRFLRLIVEKPARLSAARHTVPAMSLQFDEHIRAESDRFVAALRDCDPQAAVPSCPEWNARDLAHHLAGVQLSWATVVRDRLSAPSPTDPAQPDSYDELLALVRRGTDELLAALAGTPDDVGVWTWAPDKTVGFIRRRQAHEALIHRVDAELATGSRTPLHPALATDGVAEVLGVMWGIVPDWATVRWDGPTGRVSTTDTETDWTVQVGHVSGTSPETGTTYTEEPGVRFVDAVDPPQFTITGAAADLDCWLWGRQPTGVVRVDGDAVAIERLVVDGLQ